LLESSVHSTTSAPSTNVLPFLVVERDKVGRSCTNDAARRLAQSVRHPFDIPLTARSRFRMATRSCILLSTVDHQLSTVNCPISNRYCLRIETPVTYRKQSTDNFLPVTQNTTFQRQMSARPNSAPGKFSQPLVTCPSCRRARHSPLLFSNRYYQILEPRATQRKQSMATRSNRNNFRPPQTRALTRLRDFAILAHCLPRRMP